MTSQSPCPQFLATDVYERSFPTRATKLDQIWERLNLRESFVDGQIFPYRVEFDAESQRGPFEPGELNIHHGPLLSVHGAIGEVSPSYRSLDYFYGSYVLSFRLVRPVKLEFFRDNDAIRLKITSYVRPWFRPIWRFGNNIFWKFFGIGFLF